jgi:hypothetical protein
MLNILTGWAIRVAWLPIGALALQVIIGALREWWRKAEMSADRAGLLASQDPAASLRLAMKLAGGGDLSEVDTTAFLEQAAEFDRTGDLRESLIKFQMIMGMTHPLPVARAAQVRRWIDSGEYGRILAGDYPRRDDDRTASVSADVKAAAESYREEFSRTQDPLISAVRRLGDGASGSLGDFVNRMRGRPPGQRTSSESADESDPWAEATSGSGAESDAPDEPTR